MSYFNNPHSNDGWGDVDSREARSTSYNYAPDSDTDHYDGLEMRMPSRNTSTPSTFGLGTRKARRSPPRAPFRQPEGPETTTSSSPYQCTSSPTSSSPPSSPSSSERHCCNNNSRYDQQLRTPPKPAPRYDDPIEPLNSLSPRPSTNKRSSIGSRPSLKGNTKTTFTANGDRVEEYIGEGSLRIGTHWIDDEDGSRPPIEGLGTRGGRRGSGYGRDMW